MLQITKACNSDRNNDKYTLNLNFEVNKYFKKLKYHRPTRGLSQKKSIHSRNMSKSNQQNILVI